jgi:serine/threonine protein kinase
VSCYAASISFLYLLAFWISFRYKNQTVAIKVLHKGETPEEIAKRQGRFAREVEMLSRVQHKNLVKV